MSVWKKAAKAHQKTHKERHQPEDRAHLGILEKKKDYVHRAKDFNEKKATLKLLRKRALNKNPDEFYHHMINSKTEGGIHFEKEEDDEFTPEQLMLIRTQDLKYINMKKTLELKKIEKLQSQLHLPSVDTFKSNSHIFFNKKKKKATEATMKLLMEKELPDVSEQTLKESTKKRQALYNELGKRIDRERELEVVQQKIQVKRAIESKKNTLPPKKLKKGSKSSAPIYVWKYERKR